MVQNRLQTIEKSVQKRLNIVEIRRLLWIDPDSKEQVRPHLVSFYMENRQYFPADWTDEQIEAALIPELQERLQGVLDLFYFKDLEDSLTTRVEKRIGESSAQFREDIARLGVADLDAEELNRLRNADPVDIEEGDVEITEKIVQNYITLVRAEVGMQLTQLKQLEGEHGKKTEKNAEMRDLYEKVGYLFKFLASNLGDNDAKKAYLNAFLLKKMNSEKGFATIKGWYEDLQKHLQGRSFVECRESIRGMAEGLYQTADAERPAHLMAIIQKYKEYAPGLNLELNDIAELLDPRRAALLRDGTYNTKIAYHLETIEMSVFQLELEKMMPELDQSVTAQLEKAIADEMKELQKNVEEFQGQKYTIESHIDSEFKTLPLSKRAGLKAAVHALEFIGGKSSEVEASVKALRDLSPYDQDELNEQERLYAIGMPPEAVAIELQSQRLRSRVDEFLSSAERQVVEYLVGSGCNREDLKRLKNNDPLFDIYNYLRDRAKDLAAVAEVEEHGGEPPIERIPLAGAADPARAVSDDEAEQMDTSPYLKGDALNQVKLRLEHLQQICNRHFSQAKDDENFERIQGEIENLTKDQYYLVEEVINDEQGMPTFKDGEQVVRKAREKKRLALDDQARFEGMLLQKKNISRFQETRKKLLSLENFDAVAGLTDALGSLYSELYELGGEGKGPQLKQLTKAMTIDHPLTCIRFNAGTKLPFVKYGYYEMHKQRDEHGMPLTYKGRATALLKKAKQCLLDGDYAQLQRLFRQEEMGDRLYMDASLFPLNMLKGSDNPARINLLYELGRDDNDKVIPTRPSEKIPETYHRLFDLKNDEVKKKDEALDKESNVKDLPDCLMDDPDFQLAFGIDETKRKDLMRYRDALDINEKTGEVTINPDKLRELLGSGEKVLGAGGEEEVKMTITKERLDEIAKEHPLIAARAAQLNSELGGYALAHLQYGGRKMYDAAMYLPNYAEAFREKYWKGLLFFSPMSIYTAVEQAIEHIGKLAEFRAEFKSYWLMQTIFANTIIGSEFEKLMQAKENDRVDDFKKAFDQYGNDQVLGKLTGARDRFEFKQTLIQVFQERGLVTNDDICNTKFLKTLNKFNPSYSIPIRWTDDEMKNNQDVQRDVIDEIKKAVDKWWGGGQFQSWQNGWVSKYEGWRKQSYDNFGQYGGGPIRAKIYEKYWKWITKDRDKLTAMHPGELVGNIENDLMVGHLNSGQSFTIMQALLCEGIIKYEHLKRLELTDHHINNLPFFTFLEPIEAELCGLSDIYRANKYADNGKDGEYDATKNPFVGFYEGMTALPLRAYRFEGKWILAKSKAEYDDQMAKGNIKTVFMTAHQLQRRRQAQPGVFKTMDNACIGLFLPAYNWGEVEGGMAPDNNGEITGARNHDLNAGYRGFHHEFTGYLDAMGQVEAKPDLSDPVRFKQALYFGYQALSKTCAFAGFFARQKGRTNDYIFNSDGSPKVDFKHKEERAKSGKTNFEKMILDISGHHQRLNESGTTLDNMDGTISDDLRKSFKEMAGHIHLQSIGMDPITGKRNPDQFKAYNMMTYDPVGIYRSRALPEFIENALALADKRGIRAEIEKSIGYAPGSPESRAGVFGNFEKGDARREEILNKWRINEAQMG